MRMGLVKLGLAMLVFPGVVAVASYAEGPLQVKTDKGKIEGSFTADNQVRAFKGIPYAAPPVRELRWQPPQPAEKWKGVWLAKDFGKHCLQGVTYPDMVFDDPGASEDCLTLNVWTPSNPKGKLPVMVWIYGGGYVGGSTSEARQNGEFLAHRNVVVVSMNYRLGIFGFLAHPDLTAESPHHASGNYGLMDQAAAIAWVKNNISEFGGDPKNITIFGESAGSFSVSALMASPMSKDMIAKAIGESGGAFYSAGLRFPTREVAEKQGAEFAENVLHAKSISVMRRIPAEQLLNIASDRENHAPRFVPDVDGYFLPDSVPNIYAAGSQAHIPLLAGWNADEGRAAVVMAPVKPTAASFGEQAKKEFGDASARFLTVYGAATDEEALRSAGDYAGDRFIAYSTWRWMGVHVETGASPVYRYLFALGSPGDKFHLVAMGAFHSDDIEYVFGTLDSRQGAAWRPEDRKLSELIGAYWTNFARTGDPNGAGLPMWPSYNATGGWQVMHLDADSAAKPDAYRERYLFLDSVWSRPKVEAAGSH
ncbi:carboxylesterase/lipase family protein [Edaphobacter bradus]|uniref:carboxylesterase/lipase family protein n=1 Tax=Edaphobacter bradus TaxID=2259016 RepID=UPI0021E097B3|nr:carboxylesterase family protein [Edaphobacter bradus]